ncbi:serine hydrolase domain-containing protein [Ilumatobacter nonamiensis]|uniref:serine hydrolase domain-containing protein n=1 Tax=Ilumatobacter nonamiensis TaxID=467093 RepID=UPI000683E857|nr:serine hydrolase domain-containing protein [Ilumatobacter nonamiensis]
MRSRPHTITAGGQPAEQRPARHPGRTAAVVLVVASAAIASACSSSGDSSAPGSAAPVSTSVPDPKASDTAPNDALVALDATAIDAVVDDLATELHQTGMVVFIRTPDGEYVNTWGTDAVDSTEVPTLDTRVRIGSNTKTWTGTAILQMVEEGKLSIDDAVSTYRPDVPNGDNITIGQLLDMRSGLYNYTETLELNTALDEAPERVWTPEELLALAFAHEPYFAPGEDWHYSNTNTILLGLIAEELDAKPIAQIFEDRFFTPLGMSGSSFPDDTDTSIPDPYADGYTFNGNVETMDGDEELPADRVAAIDAGEIEPPNHTNDNPSWTWSAGQGISTATDLATWVEAMVKGDLLDPATQQLRMDSVLPTDPTNPNAAGYGYGLAQMGPLFGHTGALPGYNSFMGYDPANDVTIVIWGNLAPTPLGAAPAARMAENLIPYVYNMPAPEETDDVGEIADAN